MEYLAPVQPEERWVISVAYSVRANRLLVRAGNEILAMGLTFDEVAPADTVSRK